MTPEERAKLEQRAERCLRRGELPDALALFQRLAAAFPEDAHLVTRLEQLQESLQPAERTPARNVFRAEASGTFTSPTQEAEAKASKGDLAGAIAIYRTVAAANPSSELIAERLAELLALAHGRRDSKTALGERAALLEQLLDRVRSRRDRKAE